MTVKEFTDELIGEVTSPGCAMAYSAAEAKSLANRLLQDLCDIPNYTLVSDPERKLPFPEDFWKNVIGRLKKGEPVQYITGFEKFCGERFAVGKGVLIPRPETEELVSLIVFSNNSRRRLKIMDVCTGSGCIAWSLWKLFPLSEVYACDKSAEALAFAGKQKIERLRPDFLKEEEQSCAPPKFYRADVLSPEFFKTDDLGELIDVKFDIIVSNPPYITEKEKSEMRCNVLEYEPSEALFVPDAMPLLFYRKIAEMALDHLNPDGRIYFEVNEMYAYEVASLLGELGFLQPQVVTDISNKPRFVRAVKF